MYEFKEFCNTINLRTAASLIRFYLHCMQPDKLNDDVFIESLVDVWFNRKMEYLASKKTK